MFKELYADKGKVLFNEFCEYHKCKHLDIWKSVYGGLCYTCTLLGSQTNNVTAYPEDCPMLKDIEIEKVHLEKKLIWRKLNNE